MRFFLIFVIFCAACPRKAETEPELQPKLEQPELVQKPVEPELETPEVPDALPYPEAEAPESFGSVSPSPDSDCGGIIALPPGQTERPRIGTWALGEFTGRHFMPILFFNTKQDAVTCVGSSDFKVQRLTENGWK